MKEIPREICRDVNQALAHEWLVGNGDASYAAGTIAGALTRREQGLLVARVARGARHVLLAKVDEEIEVEGQLYKLGTNVYQNNVISPDGFLHLSRVTFAGPVPTFWYEAGRFQVSKTIWMAEGTATTFVRYALSEHSAPVRLTLLPLCDYRPADQLTAGNLDWHFPVQKVTGGFRITAREGNATYQVLTRPEGSFTPLDLWYWRFQLRADGDALTDLYVPGLMRCELAPGEQLTLIATAEESAPTNAGSEQALAHAQVREPALTLPPLDQFTSLVYQAPRF